MSGSTAPSATSDAGAPRIPFAAWYAVAICMLISSIAVLDRQILSLLVDPIKSDLAITDIQFSLLTGLAFSFFYAIAGLPIGARVDRGSRVVILASGLLVWSLATTVSSLSRSFAFLFVCRSVVGAGEAALQPATKSLITDLFYGRHLGKAIAMVALGSSIGSAAALLIGGALLAQVGSAQYVDVPVLGQLRPWQFVLACVGLPGIVLAPLCLLTLKEPVRQRVLVTSEGKDAESSYRQLWHFCREYRRATLCVILGYAIYSMAFQSVLAWGPTFLIRQHGMSPSDVGAWLGKATLVTNVLMTLASGWFVDFAVRRGMVDGALRWSLGAACLGVLPTLALPWVADAGVASILLVLTTVGTSGYVIGAIPLMQLMPSQLRGKAMVSFLLLNNIVSGICGPFMVAFFTDRVFQDPAKVGYSLAIVAGASLLITIALMIWGRGAYRAAIHAVSRQTR
ncbi:MFS transporter [Luteimonas sp. A482]